MREKDFIEYIARSIVDFPDDVKINVVEGEKTTLLELKVNPKDIGKVIGKNGAIIKALRTLLSSLDSKNGRHIALEIKE
ncbi:MAG TPA: KH domain-containing protein [Exilispira sp.]|nr:KH domain-containing protein [Exilispira sp.]